VPKKEFLIASSDENKRLDVFLSHKIKELSRSQVQKLIEEKKVLTNGKGSKSSYHLKSGDRVEIEYTSHSIPKIKPENIPLKVIHSDDHILVVDKPSGLVVHPGAGVKSGTLVNALLHHFPDIEGIGPVERSGIIHRLDKETSGVMVVARSSKAHSSLQRQFKERAVEKVYIGLVWGRMPQKSGEMTWSLGRHPKHGGRISTKTKKPRAAKTQYCVEKELEKFTLLKIKPITGRTHQIRVHLAAAGHPVAGDNRYGRRKEKIKSPRLFLHAAQISFHHPDSGKKVRFSSPLPEDLKIFLNKIERTAN
jgi:23S rRNA pseudouridine1911/1915/1917 synthase